MAYPDLTLQPSFTVQSINERMVRIGKRLQNIGDLGKLDLATGTSGLLPLTAGGTNADLSTTGGTSKFLKQAAAGAAITVVRPATADLSDFTAPTDVAFAAGNFTSSAGTWVLTSGDQVAYSYMKIGSAMLVMFSFFTTTITGGPVELYFPIPAGFVATRRSDTPLGVCIEGGTAVQTGTVKATAGSGTLTIFKPSGAVWVNGTDNCFFGGQIWVT